MAIIYRPMQLEESDTAAALHRAVGRAAWSWTPDLTTPEMEREMYRNVAFVKGKVVGAFDGSELTGFIVTEPGWVEHLYVAVDQQGQGVGSALLGIAKAEQNDLQLWTYQANLATRKFYERHGFIVAEMTDGSAMPEREPNVRYRWRRGG